LSTFFFSHQFQILIGNEKEITWLGEMKLSTNFFSPPISSTEKRNYMARNWTDRNRKLGKTMTQQGKKK